MILDDIMVAFLYVDIDVMIRYEARWAVGTRSQRLWKRSGPSAVQRVWEGERPSVVIASDEFCSSGDFHPAAARREGQGRGLRALGVMNSDWLAAASAAPARAK